MKDVEASIDSVEAVPFMEDMKVAQVEYSNWGKEEDPNSDLSMMKVWATFQHPHECEFIFYIGCEEALRGLKASQFSEEFMGECYAAASQGFKYICFYAG